METIWIGIATIMNACSASYLYILLDDRNTERTDTSTRLKIASLAWYSVSALFLLPYLKQFFMQSSFLTMSFTALIFLILTTAFHNLRKIISRCPNSKKTAFSFLTVFTLISLFHNYVYSPELSRLFLWISSGLLIFFKC